MRRSTRYTCKPRLCNYTQHGRPVLRSPYRSSARAAARTHRPGRLPSTVNNTRTTSPDPPETPPHGCTLSTTSSLAAIRPKPEGRRRHVINAVAQSIRHRPSPSKTHLPNPRVHNARQSPRTAAPHHRPHGSAPARYQPRRPSQSGGRQSDSQSTLDHSSCTGPSLSIMSYMSHGQFSTRCRRRRSRPRAWWGQESRRAAHAA